MLPPSPTHRHTPVLRLLSASSCLTDRECIVAYSSFPPRLFRFSQYALYKLIILTRRSDTPFIPFLIFRLEAFSLTAEIEVQEHDNLNYQVPGLVVHMHFPREA